MLWSTPLCAENRSMLFTTQYHIRILYNIIKIILKFKTFNISFRLWYPMRMTNYLNPFVFCRCKYFLSNRQSRHHLQFEIMLTVPLKNKYRINIIGTYIRYLGIKVGEPYLRNLIHVNFVKNSKYCLSKEKRKHLPSSNQCCDREWPPHLFQSN